MRALLALILTGASLLAFPVAASPLGDLCQAIGRQLKSVPAAKCLASGLADSRSRSVKGRPLLVRDLAARVPPSAAVGPARRPPRVMLIGGIHGDELASVSIVFRWLPRIAGQDGAAFQWRVIPLANPDGLLAAPPQRTNANGVDLNRNFSSRDWEQRALDYWTRKTGSDRRRNPGRQPASEPETRWLEQQIASYGPDVVIAVHAPYGILDFDGPGAAPPQRFGGLRLNRLGVYPGSLGNYAGEDRGIPVITLEFPTASVMPSDAELDKVWGDMLRWIRDNVPPRG